MTKDDIIRMAQTAGLLRIGDGWSEPARWGAQEIVQFAALVEKEAKREASFDRADLWLGRINEAVKQEREACAKVVEDCPSYDWHRFACETAAAIRARSNTP